VAKGDEPIDETLLLTLSKRPIQAAKFVAALIR
jgi:hypothetical protein